MVNVNKDAPPEQVAQFILDSLATGGIYSQTLVDGDNGLRYPWYVDNEYVKTFAQSFLDLEELKQAAREALDTMNLFGDLINTGECSISHHSPLAKRLAVDIDDLANVLDKLEAK